MTLPKRSKNSAICRSFTHKCHFHHWGFRRKHFAGTMNEFARISAAYKRPVDYKYYHVAAAETFDDVFGDGVNIDKIRIDNSHSECWFLYEDFYVFPQFTLTRTDHEYTVFFHHILIFVPLNGTAQRKICECNQSLWELFHLIVDARWLMLRQCALILSEIRQELIAQEMVCNVLQQNCLSRTSWLVQLSIQWPNWPQQRHSHFYFVFNLRIMQQ